ncbi:MAG: hypothetical protein AAF628_28630 [Planctomycetota bacterium]
MKTVPGFLSTGLMALLALLTACSGTPTDNAAAQTPGTDPAAGQVVFEETEVPQDPPAQDPGQAGSNVLLQRSLSEARRALQARLFGDAARIASEVLEMDPSNMDARQILLDANAALGRGAPAVQREFLDRARESQVAQEKLQFEVRNEMNLGDAQMADGKYGDAAEHYERGLLLLTYSPFAMPGGDLQRAMQAKLEAAQQARVKAQRDAEERLAALSRQELAEEERRARLQRATRVQRLVEQANFDFQLGRYPEAVTRLDQALMIEPNDAGALTLRQLAERARHENRMDVLRSEWNAEWSKTFDDLNSLDVPQTDPVVYDLEHWRQVAAREPIRFTPPEDLETPEERAIIEQLQSTTIEHRFTSAAVQDWADYYARVTDITFAVTTSVRDLDPDATTLTDFQLPPMSVRQALDVIGNVTGVKWKVEHGVVKLVTPEEAGGKLYLVQYDVRDIVQGVPNRPGPELKLKAPDDEEDFGLEDDEEPLPTVVDADKLVDLVRLNIDPDSWDAGGASITPQRGVLLVRHNRTVHEQIERLLADLRQAVGIQVDVETRFLQVEDQFLEDVGVDFRGLGNQAASGVAGRGLERNNRQNAGFDDFGTRAVVNPATPGAVGTGTEPGLFFDDGQDGDIMARTENLFDRALGGEDSLDNGGGLALQYSFLDDAELEVVLRAVSKQERSELITAPRLLVYNNSRASMSVLRHTSYIRDFDVEIAQAAAVANPIVDVVRDGVVLDVRPVVSADRRFITMELRPTVMTLQLPIPTFTTTLGVGQPVSIQLPSTTLQRVRTTVTMPDGGTLMLGGMKLAEKQFQESRIPVLGSLPGLSFLFSRKGTFIRNRKIVILIRATIVVPDETAPDLGPDALAVTLMQDG